MIWSILFYALLVSVGGIVGYLKAKSTMSLVSGVVSGVLLLVAFFLGLQSLNLGLTIAGVIAVVLTIVFALRFRSTQKFMPGGLLAIVSLLASLFYLVPLFQSI